VEHLELNKNPTLADVLVFKSFECSDDHHCIYNRWILCNGLKMGTL